MGDGADGGEPQAKVGPDDGAPTGVLIDELPRAKSGELPEVVPSALKFSRARFAAAVSDMRFTAQGDLKVTLTIPYGDRAKGVTLMDAIGLQVDVSVERKNRR